MDEMVVDHWDEIMDAAENYRQNKVANNINAEESETPEETANVETDDLVINIEEAIPTETETEETENVGTDDLVINIEEYTQTGMETEETENVETDDLVINIEEDIQTETETVADEDDLNNSNIETPVNNSIHKEDMPKQGLVDYSMSSDEGSDEDSITEKSVNVEDTTIENVPLHSTPIENLASALDNVQPFLDNTKFEEEPKNKSVKLNLVLEETIVQIRGKQIYKSCFVCQQMVNTKSMKNHMRRAHNIGSPAKRKGPEEFVAPLPKRLRTRNGI